LSNEEIKKLHLFCDVRVHEQVKMMEAIRKEIDLFQNTCDELMTKAPEETEEPEDSAIRGDLFVQSSIRRQSELIGKVLLEVGMPITIPIQIDDNSGGFHSKIATLKEQFAAEIRESTSQTTNPRGLWRRRENRKDIDVASVKKKYLGLVTESAQEELEDEYKRCVQDTVDFASNSARLFYREMAFRYWVLLVQLDRERDL
jgi:singapore isolate B (sub-type 7) whole genome shotgun sequence assembly, scaffold_4